MTRINHRADSGWIRRVRIPNGERYLVSPYMQSSNGAIEKLNWVPGFAADASRVRNRSMLDA